MNYDKIIPLVLQNQILVNPKGYFSRLRLTHRRVLRWIYLNTANIDSKATIGERVYWIIHGLHEYPLCQECKCKPRKFYNVVKGYGNFCSIRCANNNEQKLQKQKTTSINKFGKENYNNRHLARSTMKKRYGVDYFMHTKKFKDAKQNFLRQHNVDNTFQIDSIKQKIRDTKLRRYGNPTYVNIEKQKRTIASFSKQRKQEIHDKHVQTCRQKYNVDYAFQSQIIKEKIAKTNMQKYNVAYPMQSAEFRKQMLGKKYLYDNISFDSADEVRMYIWLKDNNVEFEYQPIQNFEYFYAGKKHIYMPDFKVNGIYVEIKGSQFFKSDGTMQNPFNHSYDGLYEAKHQCMLNNNVIIIKTSSLCFKFINQYINEKYGKKFIQQFKKQ